MADTQPMDLAELLRHLSQVSDPNYKQNIKDYNSQTGLDVGGRYQGYNAARYLMPAEYQKLTGEYGMQAGMQPEYQSAMMKLFQMLQNPDAMSAEARAKFQGNAMNSLPGMQNMALSQGMGDASGNMALFGMNQANRQGNEFDANLYGTTGKMNQANALGAFYNNMTPNLNNLNTLHGITTGTPRNSTGMDVIGGMAGQMAGGWANNGFKFGRR